MLLSSSLIALGALLSSAIAATPAYTALPSPSSSTNSYTAQTYGLAQTSYTYSYTYTTATTVWKAPTFATPRPIPVCTDAICPGYGGATCVDADGVLYGIICNTRLGGIVIVDSGKLKEREADAAPEPEAAPESQPETLPEPGQGQEGAVLQQRSYTGTFEGCTGFCNTYNKTYCVGVSYEKGACMAFDVVSGNFQGPGFAAMRLS